MRPKWVSLKHDWAVKTAYVEVVGAELTSSGVPPEHAFGEDAHTCPERLCTIYLPSIHMLERATVCLTVTRRPADSHNQMGSAIAQVK